MKGWPWFDMTSLWSWGRMGKRREEWRHPRGGGKGDRYNDDFCYTEPMHGTSWFDAYLCCSVMRYCWFTNLSGSDITTTFSHVHKDAVFLSISSYDRDNRSNTTLHLHTTLRNNTTETTGAIQRYTYTHYTNTSTRTTNTKSHNNDHFNRKTTEIAHVIPLPFLFLSWPRRCQNGRNMDAWPESGGIWYRQQQQQQLHKL